VAYRTGLIAVTAVAAIWGIAIPVTAGAMVTTVPVIGGEAESIEAAIEETAVPAKAAPESLSIATSDFVFRQTIPTHLPDWPFTPKTDGWLVGIRCCSWWSGIR
jgi:hypothetical protein